MRRLLTLLTALLFAACGDPTGPNGTDVPDGPLEMALVSGGGQEVQVTDTLPTDIVVQVTKGGSPLPDQLVDWTVLDDGCGEAFVSTTRTDSSGVTGNRLVAGTRAYTSIQGSGVCQMEVRYALTVADTVQARVDTTVTYRVLPGTFSELLVAPGEHYSPRDSLWVGSWWADQYGNRLPYPEWHLTTADTGVVSLLNPDSVRSFDRWSDFNAALIAPADTGSAWIEVVVGDTIKPIALEATVYREADSLLIEAAYRKP